MRDLLQDKKCCLIAVGMAIVPLFLFTIGYSTYYIFRLVKSPVWLTINLQSVDVWSTDFQEVLNMASAAWQTNQQVIISMFVFYINIFVVLSILKVTFFIILAVKCLSKVQKKFRENKLNCTDSCPPPCK